MANKGSNPSQRRLILVHSARTATAAVASLLAAKVCRIPEPFWAPITTIVITQSSLGAAFDISRQRFVGTLLGSLIGGAAASLIGPHPDEVVRVLVFGMTVFVLGLLCELPRLGMTAYRFGGVTLIIVLLIPLGDTPLRTAVHRTLSVFIGIVVALLLALVWPEREPQQT